MVIVERDRDTNDQWLPAKGAAPRQQDQRGVRGLAIKITIFAKSSLPNATVWEHEFECEQLVDAWLCAMNEWGVASKAGFIPVTSGHYLGAKDRDDVEAWAGAVYEIRATVPRGVNIRDYENALRPTGQATGVGGSVEVKLKATDDPEIVPLP